MKTLPTKSPYEADEDFQDRLYPVLFGRNRNGTFAFGNSGGPGRPKGVHSRQFDGYEHFEPTSDPEVEALVDRAVAGSITATKKLMRLLRNG
jgi:hypothetical protein